VSWTWRHGAQASALKLRGCTPGDAAMLMGVASTRGPLQLAGNAAAHTGTVQSAAVSRRACLSRAWGRSAPADSGDRVCEQRASVHPRAQYRRY